MDTIHPDSVTAEPLDSREPGPTPDTAPPTEAALAVSPAAYSFRGVMAGGSSAPVRFVVTNLGQSSTGPVSAVIDGSAEFASVMSTCGQALAGQETCEVAVSWRPTSPGITFARLTVAATPGRTSVVQLSGDAASFAAAVIEPALLDFPSTIITGPGGQKPLLPERSFKIVNRAPTPVGPLTAQIGGQDPTEFAIAANDCDGAVLVPQQTCSITIRFRPTALGARSAVLNVMGPGIASLSAVMTGNGAREELTVTPSTQSYGVVLVGMKSDFSFEVRNQGSAPTGTVTFTLDGPNVADFSAVGDSACQAPLDPGMSCGVTVTFAPTVPGLKSVTLRVTTSPGGVAEAALTGTGLVPDGGDNLTLAAAVSDPFGTVAVGDSSKGLFVVANKGGVAAGKVTGTISGANAREFEITDNRCPAVLAPGASCTLAVRFSPRATGNRVARLQASATPGGLATIALFGAAAAPLSLRVSPTTRSFGIRPVGNKTGMVGEFILSVVDGPGTSGELSVTLEGPQAQNWRVVSDECEHTRLRSGQAGCRVGLRLVPTSPGLKIATLAVSATPGGTVRATLIGTGL